MCLSATFITMITAQGGAMAGPHRQNHRYQQGPGQVDRLWILDVEGHRLLVDANYTPAATEQDRTELADVVNSIVFKR